MKEKIYAQQIRSRFLELGVEPREDIINAVVSVKRTDFLPEGKDSVYAFFEDYFSHCMLEAHRARVKAMELLAVAQNEEQRTKVERNFDSLLAAILVDVINHASYPIEVPIRDLAYQLEPLPIGEGQTCTDPSLVAITATLVDLRQGQSALEIGTGCGYAAVVASRIIIDGRLTTVEINEKLYAQARANLQPYLGEDLDRRVITILGDGSIGYPAGAPYDRIYLTAGVNGSFRPEILASQLKESGILVFPEQKGQFVKQTYEKGKLQKEERVGRVQYVPLRGANGSDQ